MPVVTAALQHVTPATAPGRANWRGDLVRLPGGPWAIWPLACLRGAGFPVQRLLDLSSPLFSERADGMFRSHANETRATLQPVFRIERLRIRSVLRELARDPRFREAVAWQNGGALRHGLSKLADSPIERVGQGLRQKELLVASYAQRYCAKNDTIGFFGPVGWARFSERSRAVSATWGPSLIADRRVYFESWCIDAVAAALGRRPELRPWQIPRIPSFLRLDSSRIMLATRVLLELSSDHSCLFAACDGTRHARAVAHEIRLACPRTFPTDDSVYAVLEAWKRRGYLIWSFEGPRELHPERTLVGRLAAIDDADLRDAATADLEAIEAGRRAVGDAAGDAEALDKAFVELESSFSRITGVAATRAAGQMYAGRTLVYEDCRRDAAVELGRDVLERLGPALSLVLHSARWAVHELAKRHIGELRRAFDELSGGARAEVTLGSLFARTSLVGDSGGALSPIGAGVREALQERWTTVLGIPQSAHRVQFRSADIRRAVRAAFEEPNEPPSAWARHICPDVMIDASSVEAIRCGQFQFVLGEIHVINTLAVSAVITQCPDRDAVLHLLHRDCPEPRVCWLPPKGAMPQRMEYLRKPDDFVYSAASDPSPVSSTRTLRVADLVVVDADGTLSVQTRDGRHRFSCMEFFAYLIMRKDVNVFDPLPTRRHRPRVTIDDVVICREQWRFPASDLTFATNGDDMDRFIGCRRWATMNNLPQMVFVRLPHERKPLYVDLCSPIFVDLVARSIRVLQRADPAAPVTVTEMLPTPDRVWLADAEGLTYTSELRLVAVDPCASRA